jgi:hypothetical protein
VLAYYFDEDPEGVEAHKEVIINKRQNIQKKTRKFGDVCGAQAV